MLARFAAHGKAAGYISARMQPALDRFAYANVFFLHAMADRDTLLIVFLRGISGAREIEIENHAAAINGKRKNKIRVEVAFIPVQHEIRVLPEVERAITLPRCR